MKAAAAMVAPARAKVAAPSLSLSSSSPPSPESSAAVMSTVLFLTKVESASPLVADGTTTSDHNMVFFMAVSSAVTYSADVAVVYVAGSV